MRRLRVAFCVISLTASMLAARPQTATGVFVAFPGSIMTVSTRAAASAPHHARVTRTTLRADERAASMTFEVALRMKDFAVLQAAVARGQLVSDAEKAARFFPRTSDYAAVVRWLKSEGLTVTRTDDNRLAVFGRGSVDAVARAFHLSFARVTTDQGEFTSAVTAPSLPANLATVVLGVHGLQPHLRRRALGVPLMLRPNDAAPPYYPYQIARAYNANTLSATGAGQTIAVYAFAVPATSDLASFWKTVGASPSPANIETVNVAGGPANSPSSQYVGEATLDVEWASSLAPGAVIRIYAANENDPANNDEILQQIYADLPSQPNLHTLSISIGGGELEIEHDYLAIASQYMANLASAGVTVLAASGDEGSTFDNALQVNYPASDPDVTGVGGTSLDIYNSGEVISETAWANDGASGGGFSSIFSRPPWQTGFGVPSGTMRCVPDVSAAADPDFGGLIVVGGTQYITGGTSWATPIWAAFCALIDQERAAAGQPPIGLLNTSIYSLIGSPALRDITSGGGASGTYGAQPGYDLLTGVGVPDMAILAQAALSPTSAPIIAGQLGSRFTIVGQPATFFVTAFGASPLVYQWQRLPAGQSAWSNLTDNGTYSGATTSTLAITSATLAMNGDEFQCLVSNSQGSAMSASAGVLTVTTAGVTTLAGWPGDAGSIDGTGWAARFSYPGGVSTDSSGVVYVADSYNNTVRRITPEGTVTTLAGTPGMSGSADGGPGIALFNGDGGVAADTQGNLYVADSGNYTIRKIVLSSGAVSTVAGAAGVPDHIDGPGASARFMDPENLAVDSAGNIYVADGLGNTIRKITPAGSVSTLAGSGVAGYASGSGVAALFDDPMGIAVDSAGNVYVADTGNDCIRKIASGAAVSVLVGQATQKGSGYYNLNAPAGVAVDSSGNVYVADSGNDLIREASPAGTAVTIAGSAGIKENVDATPLDACFWIPGDLAVDSSGTIYIADTGNMTIRRLTAATVAAPIITAAPQGQAVIEGQDVLLSVTATGSPPLNYQWNLNGNAIQDATSATLSFPVIRASQAGSYTVTVTNALGSVTSAVATVQVAWSARLNNLSSRAYVGTGGNILIVGFGIAISGPSPNIPKNLLLRGVGPGLAATFPTLFSPAMALATTQLTLYDGQSKLIVTNAGWSGGFSFAGSTSTVSVSPQTATVALMSSLGAFSLVPGSADSALEISPPIGSYTTEVSGVSGASGVALAEIYDADTGVLNARLVNLSARAYVGSGGDALIGGFVIAGTTPETVLLRAVGPALAVSPFFLGASSLAAPQLTLYDGNSLPIATNVGWGNASAPGNSPVQAEIQQATATLMDSVGAFFLNSGSADCAMIATLPPGNYTAEVSGVGNTTGIALVEIYELR